MTEDEMNKTKCFFQLAYEGPDLDGHLMNVEDLAPSLLALGRIVSIANDEVNHGKFQAKLSVNANFKPGSFLVDLVVNQDFAAWVSTLTSQPISATLNAYGLLCLIRDLLNLKKFLKGRKIDRIEANDESETLTVYIDNTSITVNFLAVELLKKDEIKNYCDKFVSPLSKEGISAIKLSHMGSDISKISKDEFEGFIARCEDEPIWESLRTTAVQIETIAFKEGHKWKVNNGNNSIFVTIEDSDFNNRIKLRQEAFREGDIFIVELKECQYIRNGKVQTENSIVKVIEHRPAPMQTELNL